MGGRSERTKAANSLAALTLIPTKSQAKDKDHIKIKKSNEHEDERLKKRVAGFYLALEEIFVPLPLAQFIALSRFRPNAHLFLF